VLKSAVLAYFKDSPVTVARALGITRSAVHQWPKVVPLKSALRLEHITRGALCVEMEAYKLPEFPPRIRRRTQLPA
jgi:transcriptional repressor of cell division inhibition gene dicB